MKDKLEVGMYVRFNYHRVTVPIQISKIKEKHYEDIERYHYYLTDNGLVISEAQILKASHNIIDLIEVGDYVNGSKVVDISIIGKDKEKWVWVEQMEDTDNKYGDDYVGYNNEQIKSIVTKEQFESMSYRIGE